VMACAFASPNGTTPETYANAGISHGRGGLPIHLSIRMCFFDPGACRGLCRAAKESLATMQWGQDRRRRYARQRRLRGRIRWRLLKPLAR
jgi:hypothetical protein